MFRSSVVPLEVGHDKAGRPVGRLKLGRRIVTQTLYRLPASDTHVAASGVSVVGARIVVGLRVAPLYELPFPSAVAYCMVLTCAVGLQEQYAILVHQLGIDIEVMHVGIVAQAVVAGRDL